MRRRTWIALSVLLVVAIAGVGYVGWRANQVRGDLLAARDDALELKAALQAGDQPKAEAALGSLRSHAQRAKERTDGPLWFVVGSVPFVGDDADGVKVVSHVLHDLASRGLPPLVEQAANLNTGAFMPKDGRISIDAIKATRDPLLASQDSFVEADRKLSGLDSSNYVDALRGAVDDLSGEIHSAAYGMKAAARATEVLPSMLGGEGKRDWLLIFQNPAELRSTGGLPGASALLRADDGKVKMVEQYTSFPEAPAPVLPLTEEEHDLFYNQLGTYFQDANFTPDFGRTAALMAEHLRINEQQEIDGVLSIDPVALSYLLRGTGPITVQGVELNADNAVEELLNKPYLRLDDPEEQNAFFAEVAQVVFAKFTSGAGSPQALLEALSRAAQERRLIVHSFIADEQAKIADTVVGANLLDEIDNQPRLGFYLNDGTGSKMSYYLDYDVDARVTGCRDGQQKYAGTMTVVSRTPDGIKEFPPSVTGGGNYGVPPGQQWVMAHVYAPRGGSFDGIYIDGVDDDITFVEHEGHTVASLLLILEPGERREVTFRMTSGPGMDGETDVYVTPGVKRENESSRLASAC